MNRKVLLFILALLFVPFCVNAASDVEIKGVELIDNADDVELENATFDGLTINFNLKFRELGDFAKYKVTIANVGNKKYSLENETILSDKDFIKYEYSYDGDVKELGVGKEVILYITATYNKEIDPDLFVNGVYEEKGKVSINIVGETIKVANPETNGGYIFGVAIMFAVSFLLLAIAYRTRSKCVVALLLFLPFFALAIEKLTIEVVANVVVEEPEPLPKMKIVDFNAYLEAGEANPFIIEEDINPFANYEKEYEFVSGMKWGEWIESEYNTDSISFNSGSVYCTPDRNYIVEFALGYSNLESLPGQENTDSITEGAVYLIGTGIVCK